MDVLRILVCASEYYPSGSGIANVAYRVASVLGREHDVHICSPVGPDIKIPFKNSHGRFGLMAFWRGIRQRLICDDSYDVVWLHNPLVPDFSDTLNCVVTVHSSAEGRSKVSSFPYPYAYYKAFAWVEHSCYRSLSARNALFTTENPGILQELKENGINDVSFILNGTDTGKFVPTPYRSSVRKRLGIPEDATVLISVGRLTSIKNPMYQLKILESMNRSGLDVALLMVGNGDLFEKCKRYLDDKKIKNAHMLGRVSYSDLPDLYGCADFYLSSSRYEGLSLSLLEAMSSGLPCIVSDIPGASIVGTAECGLHIGCKNVDIDRARITEYINRKPTLDGTRARQYAVHNFDWTKISEEYLEVFRKAGG